MRALVWLRSDLRADDNPALHAAARRSDDGVVAVFVCCPRQWREHDWSDAKVDFLLRNLRSLSERLESRGVALRIEQTPGFDGVPELLAECVREHGCDALFFNREYEVNERRRDRAVRERFEDEGIPVHAFHDQTVFPPAEIQTTQGGFYTVYGPYRRRWLSRLEEESLPELLPEPRGGDATVVQPSPVPKSVDGFEPTGDRFLDWAAGEGEARRRLESFLDERARGYHDARDLAAEDATSRLSPYLALGVISIRRCFADAAAANQGRVEGGRKGLEVWCQELIWREFYRHVLVGYPRVSKNRPFRTETEDVAWRRDEQALEAWRKGRTGVPFVDAGMRQLEATGWMHNRLRMVTAMFLTKDLLLDWRLGERHFMRRLIDGDLANNNGGWQWSASTGTDAAPYFRIFNPWTQGKRYDAEGAFIRRWVPELEEVDPAALHDPKKLAEARRGLDYPEPVVDHKAARIRALKAFEKI